MYPFIVTFMNKLSNEQSLYLRQHKDNPVDWWPWGDEAFAEAQRREVPVLVSIGYSACHWCHVMEHESFEDDYIAKLMNEHFVCIKVDREERPDVDAIYMEAVMMLNGHGGWPLNVFCLPDRRPFFGGTYFPPQDNDRGMIPWPQLLMRISDYWQRKRNELLDNADSIIKNMEHANTRAGGRTLTNEQLLEAAQAVANAHDDEWGGFGQAPKFPQPMTLDFLLAMRATEACERRSKLKQRLDFVINRTLMGMARGGLFDQVGGGFARYSVDRQWLIPHFEKMLYDNGQLIELYTKGWLHTREPLYRAVVEEAVGWLQREMLSPEGMFYAALDADSEGVEGKFYVWNRDLVMEVLGEKDARRFCEAYHITEKGNFEHGLSNPALTLADFEAREALAPLRELLLEARGQRVRPGLDEKVLVSWNALVIRGLAEAGFYLDRREWLELARGAFDRLLELTQKEDGSLASVYYAGVGARHTGHLDDYSFMIEAALSLAGKVEWLESGASGRYLQAAIRLTDYVLEHFKDSVGIGFYFTSDQHEQLAVRKKDWFDSAQPAGNSCLVRIFSALYALTGEARYADALADQLKGYGEIVERAPTGCAHALGGATMDATGVAVIKVKDVADLEPLRAALAERVWRGVYILQTDDPAQPTGYQLCVGTQCIEATEAVNALVETIADAPELSSAHLSTS